MGHEEGGQLTEAVRRHPWSVVLLDELEKAHRDIWNLLLQVMEEGMLTDSQGRRADFRNTVVVMTSNLGAERFQRSGRLGFSAGQDEQQQVESTVLEEAKRAFPPEFWGRLDGALVFHPLDQDTLAAIACKMLSDTAHRLAQLGITLKIESGVPLWLSQQAQHQTGGARPLRRTVTQLVEDPAADLMLSGQLHAGQTLHLQLQDGQLTPVVLVPHTQSAS